MVENLIRIILASVLMVVMLLGSSPIVYANDGDKDKSDTIIDIDTSGEVKVDIGISGPCKATIGAKGTSEINVDVDEQVDLSVDADETSSVTIERQNPFQGNDSIQPSASQSMETQYSNPGQDGDNYASDLYRDTSDFQRLLKIIPITIVITVLIAFFAIRHYIKNNQVDRLKGETKEGK